MADTYPYILVNGKVGALLDAIAQAARPQKFSYEFLKNIGFASSNDRAFVSLFRRLGIVSENGIPTSIYDDLRDKSKRPYVLGDAIQRLYADLFAINTNIHSASDEEIKSTISRVSGKDSEYVARAFNTFKALLALAKFDAGDRPRKLSQPEAVRQAEAAPSPPPEPAKRQSTSLHYNIQIHLPATTDVSVYNAIFKSLRDSLGIE
jgi:hypothetical protein